MLAKLPQPIEVVKQDVVERYLVLANAHDGSMALRMFFTPIRVVCNNTLTAALGGAGTQGVTIYHTGNVKAKVAEAQKALGLAVRYYDDFADVARRLVKTAYNTRRADKLFQQVAPRLTRSSKPGRVDAVRRELGRLFEEGKGNDLPGVRGTAWAAVNAVAEFSDYTSGQRKMADVARSSRLGEAWFGRRARVKAEAFALALKA